MSRIKIMGLALVAVFAMSAIAASSASAAKTGPHWWVCEKDPTGKFENSECNKSGTGWESKELAAGETRKITFKNNGNTKLKTASDLIECEKAEQTGTENEIIGGSPGTDKAKIKFTKCTVVKPNLGCEVRSVQTPEVPFGTIEVAVNTELVYTGTKKQAEEEKPPLGILFKTTAKGAKTFVELEFNGLCALAGTKKIVEATGEEHGPGTVGKGGVVCKSVEKIEEYKFAHELECVEKEQTKFFYWEGGTLKEGKAGLKLGTEEAEQVGKGTIETENAAGEKVAYDARGT
jgi:hypothetical protein